MSPFLRLRGAHLTSHPVLEDIIFTVLSLFVLGVAITAIVSPPEPTVAATVTPMGVSASPNHVVLYGTLVDAEGRPLSGATVSTEYRDGTRVASTTTAADGSWTLRFKEGPQPFTVTVTVYIDGRPVIGTVDIAAQPGMRYGVQMTFTQPSTFVFVPLPGY